MGGEPNDIPPSGLIPSGMPNGTGHIEARVNALDKDVALANREIVIVKGEVAEVRKDVSEVKENIASLASNQTQGFSEIKAAIGTAKAEDSVRRGTVSLSTIGWAVGTAVSVCGLLGTPAVILINHQDRADITSLRGTIRMLNDRLRQEREIIQSIKPETPDYRDIDME